MTIPTAWRKKLFGPILPAGEFPVDSMIERTTQFIRNRKGTDQPWFLMASQFYVHTPVKNRCRWLVEDYERHLHPDAPNREKRLQYAAFVETLDHHVGTILDAISIKEAFAKPDWRPQRSLVWHFPYYHPETTYSEALDVVGVNDFATSKTRPQSAIRDAA